MNCIILPYQNEYGMSYENEMFSLIHYYTGCENYMDRMRLSTSDGENNESEDANE